MIPVFTKTAGGYVPSNNEAQKQYDKDNYGDLVECRMISIRCPAEHRRFFVMIGEAFDYANSKRTRNHFRTDLTFEAGFYEVRVNHTGKTYAVAESLSYANMNNETFQKVHSRVLDVIIRTLNFDHDTQLYFIQNFGVPNK